MGERNSEALELKQHNMKTLLLLSILGLALVSADLKTEDQHTEEADVVAVDDSAEAMDDLDGEDSRRSRGGSSCTTSRAVLCPNEPLANGFTRFHDETLRRKGGQVQNK